MSVYQSSRNAELELLKTLQAAQGLKVVGCRFYRGLVGGIGVSVPDRAIGLWRHDGTSFEFVPYAGEGIGTRASTVDDAIARTISIATASFTGKPYH